MNKREVIAYLAPFDDDAEFLICVHKSRDDVVVRPPLDIGITDLDGAALIHVDIFGDRPSKLRVLKGEKDV